MHWGTWMVRPQVSVCFESKLRSFQRMKTTSSDTTAADASACASSLLMPSSGGAARVRCCCMRWKAGNLQA